MVSEAAAIDPNAVFQIASKLETTSWGLENTIDLYAASSRYGSNESTARLARLYDDAQLAFKDKDEEKGLQLAAMLGRTGAFWSQSHDLFVEHLYTIGGERGDFFEALGSVYERAKGGDVYAALDLGRTFSITPFIEGAVRDHELAVGWLQIAAREDESHPDNAAAAMYWLGVEYERCDAACRDEERALMWFKLAEQACGRIASDDLFPPCDGARGASLMLQARLDKARVARADQLALEWANGNKKAVLIAISSGKLFSETLSPTSRDVIASGNLSDQFAWLGTFEGLDEAQLHLWIARHVADAPTAARVVMACAGNPVSYAAVLGPAPSSELKSVCKAAKTASCRRLSRAQVVEKCTPPSS